MPKRVKTRKRKMTQAEKIAKMPIENIIKSWGQEGGQEKVRGYLRTLQSGYKRRAQSFKRQGLFSYAQYQLESQMPSNLPSIKNMSYNQLILEIAKYQHFFNAETSDIQGIRKVNREQDIRIFGVTKGGLPKQRMTDDERLRYWTLYDEYKNQQPTATSRYGSESVQQMIAQALFVDEETISLNLIDFLDRVEERLAQKQLDENLRSVPNVYSGRGPFTT